MVTRVGSTAGSHRGHYPPRSETLQEGDNGDRIRKYSKEVREDTILKEVEECR
jgi:hypothetical protein